jgi:hypothetical protein
MEGIVIKERIRRSFEIKKIRSSRKSRIED